MRAFLLSDAGDMPERGPPCLPVARIRHREEADDYRVIVATLNAGWRVIVCRDGIPWIVQRLAGKRHEQLRWEGRSYCRTRQVLLRAVRDFCGPLEASALAILGELPVWIGGQP
jgi:hypothetical protein